MTTLEARATLEFPRAPGVFVTPHFGWHFLSGPSATDMPPRLYDLSLDVSLYRPVGEQWLLQFAVAPGFYTDGDNTSSDALRIPARLMAFYTTAGGMQVVGGVLYLDREDVPFLPALGVIYQPREDLRYEIMFPKPRISWRQHAGPEWEQWVYASGELGGGSWAVRRTTGVDDVATYGDLRLVVGVERKRATGPGWFVEGGYVFNRELEFDSNVGNVEFGDTAFLRIGGSY